ncbi:protein NATD1-like [Gadus macrocephalus]|uniref:protein NATD1-like n=1 Tax=Gadus macrocephalus TaxID=80720 RepID=UPI0028CBB8D1|nr:protein NATD1-like [Gadus macrocephalus]
MALRICSRFNVLNHCSMRFISERACLLGGLRVEHDREKLCFTVCLGAEAGQGSIQSAVLRYKFMNEKQVDLMSTHVSESLRGKGIAALLSKAALDFLAEDDLKAHISCWYIKKYIEDNPKNGYEERVVN